MPYDEKPERAQQLAANANETIFPSVISGIQQNFGITSVPIYVYNVSQIEFNTPRPPNHGHLLIRACPANEPYHLVGTLEHPFTQISYDTNGNKHVDYTDGYREATVMLSPLNPSTDQNFSSPDAFNVGSNLNDYGVFWSVLNPPTPAEVAAAKARMEKTYRKELEKLAAIEAKNPDDCRALANNISHAAANYFGRSYSWHRTDLVPKDVALGKVPCEVCGELIMPTAKLCVHCGAPTDAKKQEAWLETQFATKRGPGRPRNGEGEQAA